MFSAISAEALKLSRHRSTWFLVWIYPIGLVAVFLIVMGIEQWGPGAGRIEPPQSAASWADQTAMIWDAPGSTFGRYLIAAFAAIAFAGEYGWNTWKLIVPHRARWALLVAKYGVIIALLYASFVLTGAMTVVLSWVGDTLTGDPIPRGITLQAIARAHAIGAVAALPPFLLTLAYTGLAAVLTRSMIATLIVAVVVGTLEQLFLTVAGPMSVLAPDLVSVLYHGLPGYHLHNLESWITEGKPLKALFPGRAPVALSWGASLAAAAAWIGGLTALTFALFRRQDLN